MVVTLIINLKVECSLIKSRIIHNYIMRYSDVVAHDDKFELIFNIANKKLWIKSKYFKYYRNEHFYSNSDAILIYQRSNLILPSSYMYNILDVQYIDFDLYLIWSLSDSGP